MGGCSWPDVEGGICTCTRPRGSDWTHAGEPRSLGSKGRILTRTRTAPCLAVPSFISLELWSPNVSAGSEEALDPDAPRCADLSSLTSSVLPSEVGVAGALPDLPLAARLGDAERICLASGAQKAGRGRDCSLTSGVTVGKWRYAGSLLLCYTVQMDYTDDV